MKANKVIVLVFLLSLSPFKYLLSSEKVKVNALDSTFIYNSAPFPQCHASTIIETRGGFIASWFGGTHERHPDVCIYTSSLKDGKWSSPVKVADGIVNDSLRYPCWNPVLFRSPDGLLDLYYKIGPSPQDWWGVKISSADEGKTWSAPVRLPEGILGPIKNKPVALNSGVILSPSSTETKITWKAHIERSVDGGKTWEISSINTPDSVKVIQPTLLQYPHRKIQALLRSNQHYIMESWSVDEGMTWSEPNRLTIPNPNSGIDAVTLKSGLQVLVYNPMDRGKDWFIGRNKLNVAVSSDGKIWKDILVLEDQPKGEFSYPAIIQGKDGTIHITYTYNRIRIKYVHFKIDKI